MKRLILCTAAALSLSSSAALSQDDASSIAACLSAQYAMVATALEREVRSAAETDGADPAPVLKNLSDLMASLESGREIMADMAAKDRYATLNLVDNAFGGQDIVQRKVRRAIEVCIL